MDLHALNAQLAVKHANTKEAHLSALNAKMVTKKKVKLVRYVMSLVGHVTVKATRHVTHVQSVITSTITYHGSTLILANVTNAKKALRTVLNALQNA